MLYYLRQSFPAKGSKDDRMNSISQTAYLIAMYRALETERPDALFRDRFAHSLAGGQGQLLFEVFGRNQAAVDAIAVRTRVMDELITDLVQTSRVTTVLSLGAGLDARPYRLPLPVSCQWIEVDIPEILEVKQTHLQGATPVCGLERMGLDLADTEQREKLFERVSDSSSNQVLILTEGLLSYLSETQVRLLAGELYRYSNFGWWLFEVITADLLQRSQSYWNQKLFTQYFGGENAPNLLFAPENGIEFFQPLGWQPTIFRSTWEEMHRFGRGTIASNTLRVLTGWFAKERAEKIRQQSGIVLMQRWGS
jgi:methyltransferase (TIGR00027 family)